MVDNKKYELTAEDLLNLKEKWSNPPIPVKPLVEKRGGLTPIRDWCKHYGIIYDDTGFQLGKVRVKYSNLTFKFKGHSYNFKPNDSTFTKIKGFWGTKKYYHYNINNPDPLLLSSSGIKAVMDSKVYTSILENTHIKDLNSLANSGFLAFLKKYWWLIIPVGLVVWYFSGGHNVPAVTHAVNVTTQTLTGVRK
jgi:hypothetical protein